MAATHLDVGLRCIKYLLCAVNSLFVLTGVMIISVGTTIYAVYENFSHFLDPSYFSPATLLIVVGILIFIIAFMGCCGALRESTCMVLVFAVLLSFVLLLELAAAIAAYALQDSIKDLLAEKINLTMHQYEKNEEAKFAIDFMQSRVRRSLHKICVFIVLNH
ncbi:CD63 antigen-like [Pogonomyrmex barbatus]|uniref:CD63 antigen-like n=1 Tax=Pogonomyrmex barbatus TaxID=144034 RepID=A0A6I9W490_9HYME|nr:CD63 antigen-like [Pogonomyrmex barbatus]